MFSLITFQLKLFIRLAVGYSVVCIVCGKVACTTDQVCVRALRPGSRCVRGVCDNPFSRGGCLKQLLPDWHNVRVCGSDDPPEAILEGDCRLPQAGLEYTEIRIHAQNWESSFFHAWILQIILSEILYVPVSIETGLPNKHLDFYDHDMPFDYGIGYELEALRTAENVGDCRLVRKTKESPKSSDVRHGDDDGGYVSCSHVIPEIWDGPMPAVMQIEREGIIEPPHGMGTVGHGGWYIPKFTGEHDPTLLNYLGLRGEDNRQKLAETFLRPTSWKEYCDEVSPTKCTVPDETAQRPPTDETEDSRYYTVGQYLGYFRSTEQNDCSLHPNNCTGHFVDFTCGWGSYVFQQLTHLNIALESNGPEAVSHGYTYGQMIDIWAAANATKSNVIMIWWTPEALFQEYLGTDAEFQRITLPPPTQSCIDARVDITTRCAGTLNERIGDARGSCDHFPIPLLRLVTNNLHSLTHDLALASAQHSPAYDTIWTAGWDNIRALGTARRR